MSRQALDQIFDSLLFRCGIVFLIGSLAVGQVTKAANEDDDPKRAEATIDRATGLALHFREMPRGQLAHETQHFAEKKAFGALESWELEYRAKLVELALADSSQAATLQRICENRNEAKDSPHAYANSHVVSDVGLRLGMHAGRICENKNAIGQPFVTQPSWF